MIAIGIGCDNIQTLACLPADNIVQFRSQPFKLFRVDFNIGRNAFHLTHRLVNQIVGIGQSESSFCRNCQQYQCGSTGN
jgi:hypothetical protein